MKRFLLVLSFVVVFLGGVVCGYVGHVYLSLRSAFTEVQHEGGVSANAPATDTRTNAASTEDTTTVTQPFVVDVTKLPESQQTTLRTMGITQDQITITPQMVSCAESRIGTTRVEDLRNGDSPTAKELLSLAPCL